MNNYRTLENRIRDVVSISRRMVREAKNQIEKDPNDQIVAGTYKTRHFEVSMDAQKLFASLPKGTNPDKAEKAAILHDKLFALQKQTMAKERSTASDIQDANDIAEKIKSLGDEMGVAHRMDYLKKNIGVITKYQEPDGTVVDKVTSNDMKRLVSPPSAPTKEIQDRDIDNSKFIVSKSIKAQRKLKIIDAD